MRSRCASSSLPSPSSSASRSSASLHHDARVHTTQKLRVIARRQQLLRIDIEKPPSTEVLASKLADFRTALARCDVVLLSDYGKGGLEHIGVMIREARKAGKRVLVDPKGDDYTRYKGASVVTPNLAELREVVGTLEEREGPGARARSAARAARSSRRCCSRAAKMA